jgi:hypothetical protein
MRTRQAELKKRSDKRSPSERLDDLHAFALLQVGPYSMNTEHPDSAFILEILASKTEDKDIYNTLLPYKDDPRAAFILGRFGSNTTAVEHFRHAAERKYAPAYGDLAMRYGPYSGHEDLKEMEKWLALGVAAKDPHSCYEKVSQGYGGPDFLEDKEKMQLLTFAAEKGSHQAIEILEEVYLDEDMFLEAARWSVKTLRSGFVHQDGLELALDDLEGGDSWKQARYILGGDLFWEVLEEDTLDKVFDTVEKAEEEGRYDLALRRKLDQMVDQYCAAFEDNTARVITAMLCFKSLSFPKGVTSMIGRMVKRQNERMMEEEGELSASHE